ncbi:unnamed protein product, partial [Rhizoctonia solani]
ISALFFCHYHRLNPCLLILAVLMEIMIPASRPSTARPHKSTKQPDSHTVPFGSNQHMGQSEPTYNFVQLNSGENIPRGGKAVQSGEMGPLMDSDLEGAELSKEARFWKVYVKETDQYDGDLVDGWNKSLDVILDGSLIFSQAALFSAVSTAFIIESSKKLAQDPINTSADSLALISQTLLAIASNTIVENLPALPGGNGTLVFVPSRADIIVNALWYTSLALSLATSFIAMLAKEWPKEDKKNGL